MKPTTFWSSTRSFTRVNADAMMERLSAEIQNSRTRALANIETDARRRAPAACSCSAIVASSTSEDDDERHDDDMHMAKLCSVDVLGD